MSELKSKPLERKIRRLSWQTINNAMVLLHKRMRAAGLLPQDHVIVGVPRGGLPLAIWLSNRTGIPFSPLNPLHGLPEWGKRFIIIDDVSYSSSTTRRLRDLNPDAKIVALITPAGRSPTGNAINTRGSIEHAGDTWYVFPWDDPKQERRELAKYNRAEKARARELKRSQEMTPKEYLEFRRSRRARAAKLTSRAFAKL